MRETKRKTHYIYRNIDKNIENKTIEEHKKQEEKQTYLHNYLTHKPYRM